MWLGYTYALGLNSHIGFGSSLTMRLGKPPRMLSYWLVDRYNPTTNSSFVNGKSLVVTRERIHDILRIPMGDIPMSNPFKANHEDNLVCVWKSQFPKELRRIRLKHVIEKIVNDSEAGPFFIMNFLVLYVSVMIGFPSMGTVNHSFLENIKTNVDIIRLDWCGFVLSCLNSSRTTWNRLDDKSVFTGLVGFVLVMLFFIIIYQNTLMKNFIFLLCIILFSFITFMVFVAFLP